MEALITPTIITWAIKRVRKTPEQLARELSVTPDKFTAWERGDLKPTLNQAQELANRLRIPFGYLYLSKPPIETIPLPDLRSIKPDKSAKLSPDFIDTLYDALRKQEWYREQLKNEDRTNVNFVGRFNIKSNSEIVANDIRNTIGINVYQRPRTRSWEAFLTYLIHKAEEKGVLVLRSGIVKSNTRRKLDINEFRGFVISDKLAPLIFINGNDYKTSQIFTLMHELAHLWIDQSGMLNPNYRLLQQKHEIETICDKIAAEVLVPREDFELRWDTSKSVDDNIAHLTMEYRVSAFVILRRAYSLDNIQLTTFKAKYDDLLQNITSPKPNDDGNFYNTITSRNSRIFTNTLMGAMSSGVVSPVEAARLLNVKVATLNGIENNLIFRRN